MFHMNDRLLGLGQQVGAGEQRGGDERRERVVLREALLHGLAVLAELVVAVGTDDELAAVDAAARRSPCRSTP